MSAWLDKLRSGSIVVIDGGTGSELRRRGAPWGDPTWSGLAGAARRDLLVAIHGDYIAAGAEIIIANTFGTTRFVLESAGCAERFAAVNRGALAAAREARAQSGRDVAIAGSISCLPPGFDAFAYPEAAEERAAYRELAELLAAEGADLIALEMLQDDRHAAWACEAARATGLPFWIGVSCRLAPGGTAPVAFDYPATMLDGVLTALLPYEPDVVNIMHTPANAVAAALDVVRSRWPGFVGVYPEIDSEHALSGVPPLSPEELAALARTWIDAGAVLLGGCCGTTPEHIRALKAAVAAR